MKKLLQKDVVLLLKKLHEEKEKYEALLQETLDILSREVARKFEISDSVTAYVSHKNGFTYPEKIKKQLEKARAEYVKNKAPGKGEVYVRFVKNPSRPLRQKKPRAQKQ